MNTLQITIFIIFNCKYSLSFHNKINRLSLSVPFMCKQDKNNDISDILTTKKEKETDINILIDQYKNNSGIDFTRITDPNLNNELINKINIYFIKL